MQKDSFLRNSFILTLSNLTTGILGFIFSIELSRELGPEGIGLYGLVMPVYNLFICLICGGIITAVSKIGAEYYAKKDFKNLKKCIQTTLSFNIFWAIIIVILVYIFSEQISSYIIRDSRTLNALRLTCPAMLFIALSNTLKGYFYGTSNVIVPAFIDIFEKTVRIAVIYAIATLFKFSSISATVTAAFTALCIGEFISLALLYIYYKFDIKKYGYSQTRLEGRAQLLFNIMVISLPLCINGFISTALGTISTLIVPRRLVQAGLEYETALALIGKFTGMSLSIVFFPAIVIGSISTVLIPDLSQNISKKDYYTVEKRTATVLRIAFLLGLSTLSICFILGNNLGEMFFNRNDLGDYIKFASLSVPLFYTANTTYGILNGLGKQNIILRNSLIISALELILLYILTAIPYINVFGYGISLIITSALTLILNLYEINKTIEVHFNLLNSIIYILVACLFYYIMKILLVSIPDTLLTFKNVFIILVGFISIFVSNFLVSLKRE